jgi:hypothetical protein
VELGRPKHTTTFIKKHTTTSSELHLLMKYEEEESDTLRNTAPINQYHNLSPI